MAEAVSAPGCRTQSQGFADGVAQASLGTPRLLVMRNELRWAMSSCLREPFAVQLPGELVELQHLRPRQQRK